MNLLETILNAQGGGAVQQMSRQFGLDDGQTQSAITALLPALAGAMQQNVQQEGGVQSLLGALQGGNHQRYLDDPSALFSQEGVQEGNGILGHLFGDREVSRKVAAQASAETGIGSDILKQMLPMVAGMMMGGVSRQASSSGLLEQALGAATGMAGGGGGGGALGALGAIAGMMGGGGAQAQAAPSASGGILGMLGPLLDQNRDGSALDDVLGMAARFLRK